MTIYTELTFDGMTEGASPTLPSGWSKSGSVGGVAAAASAHHGDRGLQVADTGTSGRWQFDLGSNAASLRVLDFYFRINSFSSTNLYLGGFFSLTSGGAIVGDFRVNPTTHTVTVRNGTTATPANPGSPTALVSGVWYRGAHGVNAATDTNEVRIYENESTTPLLTIVGALSSDLVRVPFIGPATAGAAGAVSYDTIRVADEWLAPKNPSVPAPPTAFHVKNASGVWVPYALEAL